MVKPVYPMQSFCPYQRQMLQWGRLWHVAAGRQISRRKRKGKGKVLSSQKIGSGYTSLLMLDEARPWQVIAWLFQILREEKGCMRKVLIFMPCFTCAVCTFPNKEQGTKMSVRICFAGTGLELFQLGDVHSTCCPGRLTHTDLDIHLWIAPGQAFT